MKRIIHHENFQTTEPAFSDKDKKIIAWLTISAVILSVVRFLVLPVMLRPEKPVELKPEEKQVLMDCMQSTLAEFYIDKKWQKNQGEYIEVQIPRRMNFLLFYSALAKNMQAAPEGFAGCEEKTGKSYMITMGMKEIPVYKFWLKPREAVGCVALIIDDFGYVYSKVARDFLRIPYPLTVSIIPGLPESQRLAQEASLSAKETLIHMPMEPLQAAWREDGYILASAHNNSILRMRIKKAFSEIPTAVGMNNHQGSKATIDPRIMQVVMSELKEQNKFFVDSFTNNKSIAAATARQNRVPAITNTLFIDARDEKQFMLDQLQRISGLSAKGENVVAIAHVRKNTFTVLNAMLPELANKGIEFVYVSELVK
ncbi:MAG TPA: divergent polysaccharide deacetylase family protein [bacterium]|nr:divergent polysaccharide deacetylase family protein [bacterium]HPN44210.1 divergent polysaccharide deacetylase family protein [bacterium]